MRDMPGLVAIEVDAKIVAAVLGDYSGATIHYNATTNVCWYSVAIFDVHASHVTPPDTLLSFGLLADTEKLVATFKNLHRLIHVASFGVLVTQVI